MPGSESTIDKVLRIVTADGPVTGPELARRLGITRQAVSLHLRQLIAAGEIVKTGSTRAARYFPRSAAPPGRTVRRELRLPGLDEARVYDGLAVQLNLTRLPDHIESLIHYAFTEMLNNAIEHSEADRCQVTMTLDVSEVRFEVRDRGIGVFRSIADKLHLDDEHAALVELIKGKTTTAPAAHSGEGIFFVSRAADRFLLRSHRLKIEWDRVRNDVFVADERYSQGTLVQFAASVHSRTRLEDVFAEYAPAEFDYRFEKTRVAVKLLKSDYLSRSEAKRLMHNLDRFSLVELDFKGVRRIGQGFADEVFRVFAAAHPKLAISAHHASPAVQAMISHVRDARDVHPVQR